MGRTFGNLTRMRHVITYSLSPFEQRAFPNYFSKGIPNVLRRTRECALRVVPRRWLPHTGTEFNEEKVTENDPILERGLPQAHWILLPGRLRVYHEAVQKKTLFPKCGPGMMYKPGEQRTALTYNNAPFYGILINCILTADP